MLGFIFSSSFGKYGSRSFHVIAPTIDIAPTNTVRNLGVIFDSEMSMKAHVSLINRSAYPQLKNFRATKPFLDLEAANTAAHAFVSSCLNAGNSILYDIAQDQLQHIQRTQNTATRIITNTRQYEHVTPVLHQLHWLPIQGHNQLIC